jgi:hypothetical protein
MKMVEKATEVGLSDVGTVFVRHFAGSPDADGNPTREYFEVLAGSHHLATRETMAQAMYVAEALCKLPPPVVRASIPPQTEEYVKEVRKRLHGRFAKA